VGEISEWILPLQPRTKSLIYFWRPWPLLGLIGPLGD